MRLGLGLPHYDTSFAGRSASWEDVARLARLAEDVGLHSVWVSDHLFLDWSKYGGPDDRQGSLECWTTLSALAAITERVRIGSLTLCNDLRNPALVAKMAASLALLADGRTVLGMGGGWYEPEYAAAGIDFAGPGTRIRRLGEAAQIVTRLLDGEDLTFRGEHYTISGAVCRPLPESRPAVWIGGKGDLLLETAVSFADGWNYSWLGSEAAYAERAETADRLCEKLDRDPKDLERSVGAYVFVGRDDADLKRRFERLAQRTPPGVLTSPTGGAEVSWDRFRNDRVVGTVSEVSDRLAGLAQLGVREVIVGTGALPFQLGDEDDVELLGEVAAEMA